MAFHLTLRCAALTIFSCCICSFKIEISSTFAEEPFSATGISAILRRNVKIQERPNDPVSMRQPLPRKPLSYVEKLNSSFNISMILNSTVFLNCQASLGCLNYCCAMSSQRYLPPPTTTVVQKNVSIIDQLIILLCFFSRFTGGMCYFRDTSRLRKQGMIRMRKRIFTKNSVLA